MHHLFLENTFINIRVDYPVKVTSQQGEEYYKYGIEVQTNDPSFTLCHSRVCRRYSEFDILRKLLSRNYPTLEAPALPTQGFLQDRNHPEFLDNRRSGLELFLKQVLTTTIYKADRGLHLFLQTSLSIQDIIDNVEGLRHDEIEASECDLPWAFMMVNNNFRTDDVHGIEHDSKMHPTKTKKPSKRVTFSDEVSAISTVSMTPTNN